MSSVPAVDTVQADGLPEQSESEALLQFVYMAPVGLVQIDAAGDILMMNPKSAQLLMPLSANAILVNLLTVLEPHAPGLRAQMSGFTASTGRVCDALRVEVPAGGDKKPPLVLQLTLDRLDRNRYMAVLTDISLQVQREKDLRKSEAWVNAIITGVKDYALATLDSQGCISNWNESIGRVTGLSEQAVKGQPFSVLFRPDAITADRKADLLVEADENGWSLDEGWRVRDHSAGTQQFWGSVLITPLETAEAPCAEERSYGLILRDLDDKRDAATKLRLAHSADFLTGLLNRRAFVEMAELEVARWRRTPRPLSLIMIDLDHFKSINDLHGHAAGDAVIRDIGLVIGEATRDVDAASRIGGEEFAVLLASTDLAGAAAFAERIREVVRSRVVTFGTSTLHYTISVGVTAMTDATTGFDALLARADAAMYAAKAAGRDRVCTGPPR
jgi:diguanylate cyclase (GGDEF)-like protein/PAS domain S-box-containing protein